MASSKNNNTEFEQSRQNNLLFTTFYFVKLFQGLLNKKIEDTWYCDGKSMQNELYVLFDNEL